MINSFKNFLVEDSKVVYFTFGRMNPPTIGHEKVLDKLATLSRGSTYRVFLSQSQDDKKNPLSYKEKIKIARKMFPRHARSIMMNKKVKNVFDIAKVLYDEGFTKVCMVVGSDRVREFDILLNKYNGKKANHGFYNFKSIEIKSAGERDPDAEGAEGMSASKMRAAVKDNKFTQFAQGLPKKVSNADAKSIFNSVRKGMGLKEQKQFKNHVQLKSVSNNREDFVEGLYQPGDKVIIKESDVVATVVQRGANYLIVESNGVQMRKWLEHVELMEKEGNQKVPQDPDVKKAPGTQPAPYYGGLKKSTKKKRLAHFKKGAKMDDDNPAAYKPAPGDAKAKTKPSKHTLKYKRMFGDSVDEKINLAMAKKRISREKQQDKIRHDRMLDRARMRDVRRKNKETSA